MILRFKDYIKEGFLSKTINRSKSGEERIEDKIHSNIDKLKGIDIGLSFLISDDFLEITDQEKISFDDYNQKYRNFIEKKGWRLPNRDDITEINKMIHSTDIVVDRKISMGGDKMYTYVSHRRKPDIVVKFVFTDDDNRFMWLDYHPKDSEKSKENIIGELWTWREKYISRHNGYTKREQRLRLIKDKTTVEEGFLSKTINRSKSGEERIEDRITSNIDELEEINLGDIKIANEDIEIDGEEVFTYYDMIKYKPYIEKHGWKILDLETMVDIVHSFDFDCFPYDDETYLIKHKKSNSEMLIPRHREWWVDNTNLKRKISFAEHPNSTYGNVLSTIRNIDYNTRTKQALLPIRLIRK